MMQELALDTQAAIKAWNNYRLHSRLFTHRICNTAENVSNVKHKYTFLTMEIDIICSEGIRHEVTVLNLLSACKILSSVPQHHIACGSHSTMFLLQDLVLRQLMLHGLLLSLQHS